MREELEEDKLNYLQQIDKEYSGEGRKWWERQHTYTSTVEYSRRYIPKQEIPAAIDVRKRIGWILILPIFFITPYLLAAILDKLIEPESGIFNLIANIVTVVGTISFTAWASAVPGNEVSLRLTIHGIWIGKVNHLVKWNYLLRSDIKVWESGDSKTSCLTLHFYDERHNVFRAYEIDMAKLAISEEKLSFYIEHFKWLYLTDKNYKPDEHVFH